LSLPLLDQTFSIVSAKYVHVCAGWFFCLARASHLMLSYQNEYNNFPRQEQSVMGSPKGWNPRGPSQELKVEHSRPKEQLMASMCSALTQFCSLKCA